MAGTGSTDGVPATKGKTIRWWARFYDAASWVMSFGQAAAIKRKAIELAAPRAGERVLDVGCGTGALSLEAKRRVPGCQVWGIDASPEMIGVARDKAAKSGSNVDFRVAAIEALPFGDAEFDLVLSGFMLHHLPDEVKRKGLAEVRRVLKPGGRFLAADFGGESRTMFGHIVGLLGHAHSPAGARELVEIAKDAGFDEAGPVKTKFKSLLFLRAVVASA